MLQMLFPTCSPPCVHQKVVSKHINNIFWIDLRKKKQHDMTFFFLRSAPLFSRTSMLSVLSTVSPSALANAWSRGDFPEEITSALKKKRAH